MRYLALVIPGDPTAYQSGEMPSAELMNEMGKFNEELAKAGVLLGLDGLHPTSRAKRIKFSGSKPVVTDGPFAEAREVIGGYWIWQVKSEAEALEWAKKAPMERNATIELRRIYEPEDFGAEVAANEHKLMSEVEKNKQRTNA